MKSDRNSPELLNRSLSTLIKGLNDLIPGIVFIVCVSKNIVRIFDRSEAVDYGFNEQEIPYDKFLEKYFQPSDTEKLRNALTGMVKGDNSSYCSILRILNVKSECHHFFYVTIKAIKKQGTELGDLFVIIAQDLTKMDIARVHLENLANELEFTSTHKDKFDLLTPREKEVLFCICRGKTNREISKDLFISQLTVETHRKNIIEKLAAHHSIDLIRYAMAFSI